MYVWNSRQFILKFGHFQVLTIFEHFIFICLLSVLKSKASLKLLRDFTHFHCIVINVHLLSFVKN